MARYLALLGIPFVSWSRRDASSPEGAIEGATHVLLLISDSAIEPFLRAHPLLGEGRTLVHFSGCLSTPLARSAHPLVSFAGREPGLEEYRRIPFVLETGSPGLQELLPGLPNPSFRVDPVLKPLYHALCVLSGNFTVLLWTKLFTELEAKLGVPREAALPYLHSVLENLKARPTGSLTGPLARGDWPTILSNLEALEGDPYRVVYQAFVEAYGRAAPADGFAAAKELPA
jgi:2-dehydropantoate 2-reductase